MSELDLKGGTLDSSRDRHIHCVLIVWVSQGRHRNFSATCTGTSGEKTGENSGREELLFASLVSALPTSNFHKGSGIRMLGVKS